MCSYRDNTQFLPLIFSHHPLEQPNAAAHVKASATQQGGNESANFAMELAPYEAGLHGQRTVPFRLSSATYVPTHLIVACLDRCTATLTGILIVVNAHHAMVRRLSALIAPHSIPLSVC